MTASRLYLIIDAETVTSLSDDALKSLLAAGDLACVRLLGTGDGSEEALRHAAGRLVAMAAPLDIAVVVEDAIGLAAQVSADGVHLSDSNVDMAAVRSSVGDGAIVGVAFAGSRHHAMEAGQAGADYVAFDPDGLDDALWWAELFEIPCVAEAASNDDIEEIVGSPIEFLALRVPSDPADRSILGKIELATQCIAQDRVKESA